MGLYRTHVFPRLMNLAMDSDQRHAIRSRVCGGLSGTVVEIGFGSGLNVPHYPTEVTTVLAVEPLDRAVALAAERIAASPTPVRHVGLTGERIDLPDASADASLSTWTLCSIPDVAAALAEVRRVLVPGGTFHFVEHGRSPDPKVARRQRRIEPISKPILAGCHLTRDIAALVEDAGFTIESLDTYQQPKEPRAFAWTFEGRARA